MTQHRRVDARTHEWVDDQTGRTYTILRLPSGKWIVWVSRFGMSLYTLEVEGWAGKMRSLIESISPRFGL